MGNPSVRCLSFLLHTQNIQFCELGPHSQHSPRGRWEKGSGGSCPCSFLPLGNTLQVTAPAVPHLPAPTVCGIKALIWSQCLKANSSEARDWGSTAFSCPGTGNSRRWGKGNVGNLCGDAPPWEPGYKAAKCCEVQASLRSHVLWKDLWIPSFILRYWCSPLWTYMVYSAAIVWLRFL